MYSSRLKFHFGTEKQCCPPTYRAAAMEAGEMQRTYCTEIQFGGGSQSQICRASQPSSQLSGTVRDVKSAKPAAMHAYLICASVDCEIEFQPSTCRSYGASPNTPRSCSGRGCDVCVRPSRKHEGEPNGWSNRATETCTKEARLN